MVEPNPRAATGVEARSTLTCPKCSRAQDLAMPTYSCLFFHPCAGCGPLLSPKPGNCCVFCSYGSAKCPPKQAEAGTCCEASAGDDVRAPGAQSLNQGELL